MSMLPKLWTISGAAVETGIDRRTVASALREVPADGKSGPHRAWRLKTILKALGGADESGDYGVARIKLMVEKAAIAAFERKRLEGSVIEVETVKKVWCDIVAMMRARLLAIPSRVAPLVAVQTDIAVCFSIVEKLIYEALQELSETPIVAAQPGEDWHAANAATQREYEREILHEAGDGEAS